MAGQKGAGRKKLPPELARSEDIRVCLTAGQKADLEHIADAWGCGMATVAFAFIAQALSKARTTTLDLGCLGAEFGAAVRLCASQATSIKKAERGIRADVAERRAAGSG